MEVYDEHPDYSSILFGILSWLIIHAKLMIQEDVSGSQQKLWKTGVGKQAEF